MAARRRRASSPFNPLGSLVFTAGIIVFAVMLYVTTRLLTEPMPAHWLGNPPLVSEETPEAPLHERIAAVTRRLEKAPLRLPTPIVEPQGGGASRYEHRRYEITLPAEEASGGVLRALLELARDGDPTVVAGVEDVEGGQRGEVGVDGLLTHTVVLRWKTEPTPAQPRVAIVIDDMGTSLLSVRNVLALPFPVAIAVMPFRTFSREVAESAHQRDREVLLHLPMEAEGGEESGAVELMRVSDPPDQVLAVLDRSLRAVPHAIGVTNDAGPRFSEDPERMRVVLERLRQQKLFFLDGVSTPRSSARSVAGAVGVPYLARKVLLDDVVDEGAIAQRLRDALAAAKRDGQAIAIGHAHTETLTALEGFADLARQEGVQIVPLSSLVGSK